MNATSDESELFRALCADVVNALKPHISDMGVTMMGQQAWVEGRMTDGRYLSAHLVISDSTLKASDDTGPWWDWTPTP